MNDPRSQRTKIDRATLAAEWIARLMVCAVFVVNVWCAVRFLASPELYAPGFGLPGVEGRMVVQGFGLAFLMWNTTYPLVIVNPRRHTALFVVILAQQSIGFIGEAFLLWSLPAGYDSIAATIMRFVQFDAVGLVLLVTAFVVLRCTEKRSGFRKDE